MTRRKLRIYVIAVGLGLAALIVDRLTASGGTPASAEGAAILAPTETPSETDTPNATSVLAVAPHSFPSMLPALVPDSLLRDPFLIPEPARVALSPPETDTEPVTSKVTGVPASEQFLDDHELSAIVRVGANRVAVVDGLMVAVGQAVDECRLAAIGDQTARFTCADADALLTIEPALPDGSGKN